tara:strand:+ start:1436 stop:1924 length:489 start_codon:yes stop_codon:yes gene_type:complete
MQKVDLEYQHIANITPIKNIVLCKNKESAKHFLDYVYNHFIDCIVASADCEYPKNSALKDKVFFELRTNPKINLIVVNADALNNYKIKTQKILVLDDLFQSSFRPLPYKIKFSPQQIAVVLNSFCKQDSAIKNETNITEIFKNQKPSQVDDDEINWIKGLYT